MWHKKCLVDYLDLSLSLSVCVCVCVCVCVSLCVYQELTSFLNSLACTGVRGDDTPS